MRRVYEEGSEQWDAGPRGSGDPACPALIPSDDEGAFAGSLGEEGGCAAAACSDDDDSKEGGEEEEDGSVRVLVRLVGRGDGGGGGNSEMLAGASAAELDIAHTLTHGFGASRGNSRGRGGGDSSPGKRQQPGAAPDVASGGGGAGSVRRSVERGQWSPAGRSPPPGEGHGVVLGGTTGQPGRTGRCAVCVIQRKGE